MKCHSCVGFFATSIICILELFSTLVESFNEVLAPRSYVQVAVVIRGSTVSHVHDLLWACFSIHLIYQDNSSLLDFVNSTVLTKLTRFLSFLNRNKVAYYNTVKAKQIFEIPNLPNRPFQIIVLICTVFPSITRIQCTFSTVCVFIEVTVIFSCQLERVRCWPNRYHGLLEYESPAKRSGCQRIITTTCLR